ncbi:MAG: hypothetical protein AB8C95_02725 [Phycisphaeraceae bacterium]
MSDRLNGSWFLIVLMLIVTFVVASTAIRIEWYNHAVGGFLPRPQPPSIEGNEIKWRTTSADMAEKSYRRGLAYERGIEPTDEIINSMVLSAEQKSEVQKIRRHAKLRSKFRNLVSSMGCMQYLLVPVGIFLCVLNLKRKIVALIIISGLCLAINVVAGGLMFYREYFSSLGW